MRRIGFGVLLGMIVLLLGPGAGLSQLPSGGKSSSRGMFGDPSKLFDLMSGGKDVITRDAVANPFMQRMFDRTAEQMGITDGRITREQFNAFMQQRMSGGATPSPSGSPGNGASSSPGSGGSPGGFDITDIMDRMAESIFRRLDANGDGLLNYDEMPENLRAERDKWDTSKDGFIDLNDFKAYFKAVMQQRMDEGSGFFGGIGGSPVPQADPIEEEEKKPVVYRAGKLPKELPAWFKEFDTNGDGQISLFEWRSAGKSLEEFQKSDRNGDGFLTIAEVLYYTQGKNYLNGVAIKPPAENKNAGVANGARSSSGLGGNGPLGPDARAGSTSDGKGGNGKSLGPPSDSSDKGKSGSKGGSFKGRPSGSR